MVGKIRHSLSTPSPRLLALFRTYLRWHIPRHFHGLRVANAERCPKSAAPLIVYLNHPSWWDPLTGIMLARHLMPGRDHYTPMDAEALAHYSFFRSLGVFPVEQRTLRGAAQFLRSSVTVLEERNAVLWLTPQAAFSDVRERPLTFRRGLAALVERLPGVTLLPIAVEYTYWNERLPDILVNVGQPFQPAAPLAGALESTLAAALDELAALGRKRDPSAFHTVLAGSAGTGAIYDTWLQLRSLMRGRKYRPEHGDIHRR